MSVLINDWIRHEPRRIPFTWMKTELGELLSEETASRLAADFPVNDFTRTDASGRVAEKTYRNLSRPVADADGISDDALPGLWQELVAELLDDCYRRGVAQLLRQPVARALEIRLVRHSSGDWLSPHTDRDDKLFSHILYFSPGWREEWGGCLEILSGPDPTAVDARVVPELGSSVVLARTDHSWHQVTKVTAADAPDRTSLLVHGLR